MIFDSITFDAKTFKGAQTEKKTLYIYTSSKTFDIDYKSAAEAQDALHRLNELLADQVTSKSSVLDILSTGFGSLKSKVQVVKDNVTERLNSPEAAVAQIAVEIALEAAKEKVQSMLDKLDEKLSKVGGAVVDVTENVLHPEHPKHVEKDEKPDASTKRFNYGGDTFSGESSSIEDFKKVFGTPDEPLIEDMTMTELTDAVQSFVSDALKNPEVQSIFEEMTRFIPKEKAEDAVTGLQRMIVELALANPKAKLSQIIQKFFG